MTPNGAYQHGIAWHIQHGSIRTDSYVLLAALLTGPPDEKVIDLVRSLHWLEDLPDELTDALASLKEAGTTCRMENIAKEYDRLFVGLGSGELIPYSSWYLEKMIQSKPLAAIRGDLARLGIVRQSGGFESEDHAGALCEVMALLCMREEEVPEDEQANFFFNHLSSWMSSFFQDLQGVKKSKFYRAVGEFGRKFIEGECEYLKQPTPC